MRGSLLSRREVLGGLLLLALGLGFLLLSFNYPMGSARRIGAGVFPALVAGLLVVVGLLITLRGLIGTGERIGDLALKPLVLIVAAIGAFALMLKPLGFVPATFVMILLAARAHPGFRWPSAILLAVVTILFGGAVFIKGLGLPMPLFGPLLRF